MTALMLASVSGHMGTIRALIDAGADYNPEPSIATCQVTPLMIAAQHGNDAVVRLYLDKGVNANKATPKTGNFHMWVIMSTNSHIYTGRYLHTFSRQKKYHAAMGLWNRERTLSDMG